MQQGRGEPRDPASDPAAERVREEIGPVVTELGMDLEAVAVTPAGKRPLLRVAVDRDGGVSLDDVAEATREISRALDETDAMGERAYTLEVTSRGVGAPLELPRHWRRAADRLVTVTTRDQERFTGRVLDADDSAADLAVDGEVTRRVAYADVVRAVVEVEFNRKDGGA